MTTLIASLNLSRSAEDALLTELENVTDDDEYRPELMQASLGQHFVAQVVELAMEFRHRFQRDVVIDMYCYRRLGHNESDEPRFTQPIMYKTIDSRATIRESYLDHLTKLGEVSREEGDAIAEQREAQLQKEFEAAKSRSYESDTQTLGGVVEG